MLCDIYEALNINNIDTSLVREAVANGYEDFIVWECPQFEVISEQQKQKNHVVLEKVMDILEMWRLIEDSIEKLSKKDKEEIENLKCDYKFKGFDGNNEAEYGYALKFILKYLHRYSEFIGRDLNTHAPRLDKYNHMLIVKNQIIGDNAYRLFKKDEIYQILKA